MIQKLKTITAIVGISFFTLGNTTKAQLNGTYTVYGDGANYANLSAVGAALMAGLSGPVTFRLRPGVWASDWGNTLHIPHTAGWSVTNTVIFEAENGDPNTTIIINTNSSSNPDSNCIFCLNKLSPFYDPQGYTRIKNLTIRNLTLINTDPDYGCVLRFEDSVYVQNIENCIIKGNGKTRGIDNYRIYTEGEPRNLNDSMTNNFYDTDFYGQFGYLKVRQP